MAQSMRILLLVLPWTAGIPASNHAIAVEVCGPDAPTNDQGYEAGRAHADFDGDGCTDFCRVVGVAPGNEHVSCLISQGPLAVREVFSSGTEGGEPFDWGYPWSRAWIDVNDDGKVDFCRNVAAKRASSAIILRCTLSAGDKFGDMLESNSLPNWGRENEPRSYEFFDDNWHICFVGSGATPPGKVCHSIETSGEALRVSERPMRAKGDPAPAE